MKVRLLAVGKLQEAWLRAAFADYEKRLARFCRFELLELPEAPSALPTERRRAWESERMARALDPQEYTIALDLGGEMLDSPGFAALLEEGFAQSGASVTLLIGGSDGFAPELPARCRRRVAMGRMTFPHQLARVILMEQLFRAFKINRGERYHK